MGLYDHIHISIACFNCGQQLTEWQTKDGPCALQHITLLDIPEGSFYGMCTCNAWNEYKVDVIYFARVGSPDAAVRLEHAQIGTVTNKVASVINLTRVQDRALARQTTQPIIVVDDIPERPRVEEGRLLNTDEPN
jgi:hypothetical protein